MTSHFLNGNSETLMRHQALRHDPRMIKEDSKVSNPPASRLSLGGIIQPASTGNVLQSDPTEETATILPSADVGGDTNDNTSTSLITNPVKTTSR